MSLDVLPRSLNKSYHSLDQTLRNPEKPRSVLVSLHELKRSEQVLKKDFNTILACLGPHLSLGAGDFMHSHNFLTPKSLPGTRKQSLEREVNDPIYRQLVLLRIELPATLNMYRYVSADFLVDIPHKQKNSHSEYNFDISLVYTTIVHQFVDHFEERAKAENNNVHVIIVRIPN